MSDLSKPDSKIREKKKSSIAPPPSLTNSTRASTSSTFTTSTSSSSFSSSLIKAPSQLKSSKVANNNNESSSVKTLKSPIISTTTANDEDEQIKKNRRKSFGGTPSKSSVTSSSSTTSKDDSGEGVKKKSLKRKSIESGNIFQFDSAKDTTTTTTASTKENNDSEYIKKLKSVTKSIIDTKTSPSQESEKKQPSTTTTTSTEEKKPRRLSVGVKSSSKSKVTPVIKHEQDEEEEEQEKPQKSLKVLSTKKTKVEEPVESDDEEERPKSSKKKSLSQSSVVVSKKKDKLPTVTTTSAAKDLKEKEKKKKTTRLSTSSTTKKVTLQTVDEIQRQEKLNQPSRFIADDEQPQQQFDPSSSVIGTTSNIPTKANTRSYPKTPLPGSKANPSISNKYYTPLQSLPSTPATHRSTMSTSSYQYPASPLPPMDGFEYSESPVSIPNISYLSPSEKDVSFDTDQPGLDEEEYNNQILDDNDFINLKHQQQQQPIRSFALPQINNRKNRQQQQQQSPSSPILSSITSDLDKENWFKYVLVVVSFIFWAIILFTLFGFYYHFNDTKYCDTDMIPERINGRYECEVCPDKGICMRGAFVGCKEGYVKRNNECILDPSKVENLVNALSNIENILRDRKGKYECGTQPTYNLNKEQLRKEFSSRYWIGNKEAMESFDKVMSLIDSQEDPEEIGIDKSLTRSIGFTFEDNEYKYETDQESIRPLWCQSLFFCKQILMSYLPVLGVVLMAYGCFKYYKFTAKKKQEEILKVDAATKKVLEILQQRKARYEEPWISEIVLREEVIGPEKNKRLDRIWEKTLEKLYQNRRVISTPKLVHGESQLTFEWMDSNQTPKKN